MVNRRDFPASLYGELVADLGSGEIGTVSGRYARAINIRLARKPFKDRLLSLIDNAGNMSDLAILIDPDDLQRTLQSVNDGDRVVKTENTIGFDDGNRAVLVTLADAASWSGYLGPDRTPSELPQFLQRAHSLTEYLINVPAADASLLSALSSTARAGDDHFIRRAREVLTQLGDPTVLTRLVGLGAGFTPAGDDFVAGYLLGSRLLDTPPAQSLADAIRADLSRTTLGGATLLDLALRDRFPAYYLEIVSGLNAVDVDAPSIERIAVIARSHGATSGLDFVAGLSWRLGIRTEKLQVIN